MMKPSFLLVLLACLALPIEARPVTVHRPNFHLLSHNDEILFPFGVNAGFLLRESYPESAMEPALDRWQNDGINTLRISVQDAIRDEDPINRLEQEDGTIVDRVLARLDRLMDAAEERNQWIVLVLFDHERISRGWPHPHYHRSFGGPCTSFADLYQDDMLERALNRTRQLVAHCQGRNILAFDIANGINAWERFIREENEIRQHARVWSTLVKDQIHLVNEREHLTAATFLPNTFDLVQVRFTDLIFVAFQSEDEDALLRSLPRFLDYSREYTRPIFVADLQWTGEASRRDAVLSNAFWLAMTRMSSVFLSPVDPTSTTRAFASADRTRISTAQRYLPLLELDGVPRAPSVAPIQVAGADEYQIEEKIVGTDRLFWIRRLSPVTGRTALRFATVEGKYTYQWFEPETRRVGNSHTFALTRRELMLETPEFVEQVWGVLRLDQRPDERFRQEHPMQPSGNRP